MIERRAVDEVKRVLIEEAQTDVVGLWAVLWEVEHEMPALTPEEAKQATLTVIREALAEERVVAGEFVDRDEDTAVFVPWRPSVSETVARIEREWASLGRKPNPGEIAWFVDPRLLPVTLNKHPMGKDWKPQPR